MSRTDPEQRNELESTVRELMVRDREAAVRFLDAIGDSPELWQDIADVLPRALDPQTAGTLLAIVHSASAPEIRRAAIRALVEGSSVGPITIEARSGYEDEVGLHPLF